MDNHLLVSASNAKKAVDKSRTPEQTVDGDEFARLLDEKVNSGTRADKEQEMVSGKEAKKNSAQDNKELEEQFRQRMGLKMDRLVGTRDFIFNLATRDPATLSISDRQSLHLGEFSRAHLEVKDFQNALADHGLHLKDLSFTQIAQLSRSHSRDELSQQLQHMDLSHPVAAADVGMLTPSSTRSSRFPNSPLSAAYIEMKTGAAHLPARSSDLKATEAAEARKLQREGVIRQIMAHIDVQKVAHQTEVSLRLNPEFLGDLKIKLNFEGRGHLAADFETTSKETKALIDEGMDSLRSSFERQGMTLTSSKTHLVEHVT